jgi:hypothetical protein
MQAQNVGAEQANDEVAASSDGEQSEDASNEDVLEEQVETLSAEASSGDHDEKEEAETKAETEKETLVLTCHKSTFYSYLPNESSTSGQTPSNVRIARRRLGAYNKRAKGRVKSNRNKNHSQVVLDEF